jgi:hypothetical protein
MPIETKKNLKREYERKRKIEKRIQNFRIKYRAKGKTINEKRVRE